MLGHPQLHRSCDPTFRTLSSLSLPPLHLDSRYRRQLLQSIWNVMRAPYAHVSFAGNLIGDILTSFTLPLADLEWMCAGEDRTPRICL